MVRPRAAISPGADRNSLNRAVRAVLADGGSVLIIDERVADAFAAPADDLERYHDAWAGGRDVVGPGTTIQRDPRDGEPWVRAATFSTLVSPVGSARTTPIGSASSARRSCSTSRKWGWILARKLAGTMSAAVSFSMR